MKIGNVEVEKGILLAPMEDVTDLPFRVICKRLGADIVYTEFVNSEGLVRGSEIYWKRTCVVAAGNGHKRFAKAEPRYRLLRGPSDSPGKDRCADAYPG